MILFGTGTKRLTVIPLYDGNCMKCGKPTITVTVFQKYFHVFFIPFIPTRKTVRGECRSCSRTYEEDDLPTYFDPQVGIVKQAAGTPLVLFTGLALFILLGAFTTWRESTRAKEADSYLAAPQVHDIYVLPLGLRESFKYVICRLEAVASDSLTFSIGTEAYGFRGGANKAVEKESFDKEGYFEGALTLAKKDVAEMLKGEDVKPIVRPGE
jgi:hypothetical protein